MSAPDDSARASFRFGAVFALTLLLVVLLIAVPSSDGLRAAALAIQFAALLVVVATSREQLSVRRFRFLAVGATAAGLVIAVAVGAMPAVVTYALTALLSFIIPLGLIGGLARLIGTHGVTLQVVAGALAIYLLIGMVFVSLIGIGAHASSTPYFAQGSDGSLSDRVYYSFTVLTTTGFGDFTAARGYGRALAVVEMLTGQLYLVTVIGVVVGDLAGRRRGPG